MLFLGAGASKAIGYGDLKDQTSMIKNELKRKGCADVYERIEARLARANKHLRLFDGEIDLEVVLSILNANVYQDKALLDSGPFTVYVSTFANVDEFHSERVKLSDLKRIRKTIGNVLSRKLEKYNADAAGRAKRYYQNLFQIPMDLNHRYRTKTGFVNNPPLFDDIVTTNYDRVVENLYEDNEFHGRPPRIGFKEDIRTQERYLDTEGILSGTYFAINRKIEYLKLHGSIDWRIRESDNRIVQRENDTSFRGEKYPEQVMIYPAYEKYVSEDPYFSLYYYFRYLLHLNDVYIVIGFSFRDPSINNAFRDALTNKPASRMIIVNSDRRVRKKVYKIFPRHKIDFVYTRFGDENLQSKIKGYLS